MRNKLFVTGLPFKCSLNDMFILKKWVFVNWWYAQRFWD